MTYKVGNKVTERLITRTAAIATVCDAATTWDLQRANPDEAPVPFSVNQWCPQVVSAVSLQQHSFQLDNTFGGF